MKKLLKCILYLFITIIIIIIYSRYIGTSGLITKEYPIYDNNLPDSFDGLKIVHFSDLHYNRAININKVKKIVNEINLINPDIVVFTGDLIDKDVILNNNDYQELTTELSKIKSKYGKYSIIGNHDIYKNDELIKLYNDSNFIYLENSNDTIISKQNEKIELIGLDSMFRKPDYEQINIDKTNYKILLIHEPDYVKNITDDDNISIMLSGHSHNGQVRIPFIGAIITPKYSEEYYDEYYLINNTKLYISSGIGVSTLNYRLFNKPSINFYRIYKTK